MSEEKKRFIQEFVPGKQITLSHLIANPDPDMFEKLGIQQEGALGILTLTPSETVIIAGDLATKAAHVQLGFLDRFTGSLVIVGERFRSRYGHERNQSFSLRNIRLHTFNYHKILTV